MEEYAIFVASVREAMTHETNIRRAVTQAVDDCIIQGILKDILVKHKAEVVGMVLTTFEQKKYEKAMQEEWKELGLEEGRTQGLQQGLQQGAERFSKLNLLLIKEKRYEELERASREKEYREKLYLEYHI